MPENSFTKVPPKPVLYYPVFALIYIWSLTPLPLLHIQSSIFSFLLWNIIGYRKKVVLENLRNAFPGKNEKEIKVIARGFYNNFCDVIVEIVKQASISKAGLKKRVKHQNPEVIKEMTSHGGGGIAIFAHYCNWEWLGAGMGLKLPFKTVGVYQTLSSRIFNRLMFHIRTRLGNDMITMEETFRYSLNHLKRPCYIAFLGDQSPARHKGMFFTEFLGRPAPIHLGIASISLKMNIPLYYFHIIRIKRGYYDVKLIKIPHEDLLPYSKESVYALTKRHVEFLEGVIRAQPAFWLWSHKRWKRKLEEGDILYPGYNSLSA